MFKQLLSVFALVFLTSFCMAQVTILDHESPTTTTNYRYFGHFATPGPPTNSVVANPDPTGINTSAMVGDFIKPAGAEVWAGAFPDPALQVPVVLSGGATQVCVKVYMDHIGNLGLKLEASSNLGPNWIRTKSNTKINEWEELCFDMNEPSIEGPFLPAAGFDYNAVVLFFDFGVSPPTTQNYFFDDLVVNPPPVIPTMGEWSLFYLAMLMVIFGVVFITQFQTQSQLQLSGVNQSSSVKFSLDSFPFEKEGFVNALKIALCIVPFGFAFIYMAWGEIIIDDLFGMTLAIPLVAYLIYLLKDNK